MSADSISGNELIKTDAWASLKTLTDARIALGSTGVSIPLKDTLRFKLDHADARDAVYSVLDKDHLYSSLAKFNLPLLQLSSCAKNRQEYLQRPDRGRIPDEASIEKLKQYRDNYDIVLIAADGLSANAVNLHAAALLNLLIPDWSSRYSLAPLILVEQGRVAIADTIASILNARFSVILIGERPGLSSSDSMGAYLTYDPMPGLTDEKRNCISNIRHQGLGYDAAAAKINDLISRSFMLKISGVDLKDETHLL